MSFRFSSALFAACITLFSFTLNAQSFAVVLDSTTAKSGQIVCIPVFAQGFSNIVGYQYSLEFNEQVLTFHHTQKYALPDLGAVNFNMYLPGVLTTAWTDPVVSGVSRENGAVLYEVCFTAVGSVGSSSPVTPGGTLPPVVGGAGVYNLNGEDLWNPNLNAPGLVEINLAAGTKTPDLQGTPSFQLSPNPTAASAQVSVKSAVSGFAMLTVTDAAGRTILDQKVSLRVGDNSFEIPAKALTAKGMYQVSVQTDKGVSTQMLSVQ